MTANKFHLGWFLNGMRAHAWQDTWAGTGGRGAMSPDFYIDFVKQLERACLDYLILEDSSFVPDAWEGSHDFYVKSGYHVHKMDPAVVASMLTQVTSKLGIVVTLTVTEYPPYLLARYISTLDHVSQGRAGWNMVTGSSDRAQQNYGRDGQPPHDVRYEMATEFTELVWQLWESWEPGSVLVDQENGIFADPSKVHNVNFEGKYYKSRGPINTARAPQGKPVIVQAGGSPAGRAYAAQYADSVIASAVSVEVMKEYRADVRAQALTFGRKPDDVKVLFNVSPILGDTMEDAQARKARSAAASAANPMNRLANMGFTNNIDFSQFDLDVPIGELAAAGLMVTNGHQSSLDAIVKASSHLTLREFGSSAGAGGPRIELLGTPDQVAAQMGEVMEEVGGDGFLFTLENTTRRAVAEITEGLVPALQRRGLVRTGYSYDMFRDNLLEF
ncbi:MAG TPA: NtaA/DmoA family FMN-dependent monooxygenase [Ilumatobacter sp.]|nr:NtaA/DmoA family FMN-dependent monooxygenase [Ilumatobacter sp.]